MTKQEKIQEAYGEHWETVKDYVDENGWMTLSFAIRANIGEIGSNTYQFQGIEKGNHKYCRILTLSELEANNGWIKIESEGDLPKEDYGQYHVYSENEMYSNEPKNQGIEPFWTNDKSKSHEWMDNFTHYQPIVKPQPPIY